MARPSNTTFGNQHPESPALDDLVIASDSKEERNGRRSASRTDRRKRTIVPGEWTGEGIRVSLRQEYREANFFVRILSREGARTVQFRGSDMHDISGRNVWWLRRLTGMDLLIVVRNSVNGSIMRPQLQDPDPSPDGLIVTQMWKFEDTVSITIVMQDEPDRTR